MASNAEKPVKKKDALVRESESSKSLDAVLVGAVLLFGISAALFAADRMSRAQRMQWTAGLSEEPLVCWLDTALAGCGRKAARVRSPLASPRDAHGGAASSTQFLAQAVRIENNFSKVLPRFF